MTLPETVGTASAEAMAPQPEAPQPELSQPEASQPEASQPEAPQPEAPRQTEENNSPSNKAIYDLLVSLQRSHQKVEERVLALEQTQLASATDAEQEVSAANANHPSNAGEEFIGAIDQGTTSSRSLIFNKDGEPVASHQVEFRQIYPHPGYVLIWHSCVRTH